MTKADKYPKILIVDDVPSNVTTVAEILSDNYQLIVATNGWDVLETAASERPDLILLNVIMPEMDSYTVCKKLKADKICGGIPIIFVTANTDPEHITRGIEVGAFYYLTKPIDSKILLAIVKSALMDTSHPYFPRNDFFRPWDVLAFMDEGIFRIRTLEDALRLSGMLSEICPEPERRAIGLRELIVNALEHGTLGITYEEKSHLNETGEWAFEVARRLALDEHRNKYVTVRFQRKDNQIQFLIKDEGAGFDWPSYVEFDPRHVFDSHGRGIALAKKIGFDFLEYHGTGNEVLAVVYTTPHVVSEKCLITEEETTQIITRSSIE
ncbi:Response regulator receiver protein [Gammaproteobacteria bacterium]